MPPQKGELGESSYSALGPPNTNTDTESSTNYEKTSGLAAPYIDPVVAILCSGLILLIALVLFVLVIHGGHSATLDAALVQMQESLTRTFETFERFVIIVLSAVERFAAQLRIFFQSFIKNISAFAAQAIEFFVSVH